MRDATESSDRRTIIILSIFGVVVTAIMTIFFNETLYGLIGYAVSSIFTIYFTTKLIMSFTKKRVINP